MYQVMTTGGTVATVGMRLLVQLAAMTDQGIVACGYVPASVHAAADKLFG